MDKCYIVIMPGEFGQFHRTSLVRKLAEYVYPSPVLVISRPKDLIVTPFKKANKFKVPLLKREDNSNLYIITPFLLANDRLTLNLNILKPINYFFLKKQIKQIIKSLKIENLNKIAWLMHPDLIDYLKVIPHNYVIYDSYDEFIVPGAVKNIGLREKELVKIANLNIVVSDYLKLKKSELYPEADFFHSSNAVDLKLFRTAPALLPDDIRNIPKPIVGYIGNIKKEIDLDLIIELAGKRPDISFVFIGKIEDDKNKYILEFPNMYFLGGKDYKALPDYTRCFDIGIIPYKLETEHMKSISPLKLYEYLASDLCVVSTPIPDVVDFSENNEIGRARVKVADSPAAFLGKIDLFLKNVKPAINTEQLNTISWEHRLEQIFAKMKELKIIGDFQNK